MDKVFITYKGEVTKSDDGTLDIFIPVSSKEVDRSDEVVDPQAFKKTLPKFMKHPVLVASHDYGDLENQIGEWTRLRITENGLEGRPKYYKGEGNPTADWAYNLASKNRAAFSVGFIPLEYEDGDGEKKPRRTYKQVELLEISQCIIPANRAAVMGMMAKSIDPVVKELCAETLKELPEEAKPEIHEKKTSQETILDEIDYLNLMLEEVGASDKVKESLQGVAEKYLKPLAITSRKDDWKIKEQLKKIEDVNQPTTEVVEEKHKEPTLEEIQNMITKLMEGK